MSQFMGHSRGMHDRHYRVQYGVCGLFGEFKQLESLQLNPILSFAHGKMTIQFIP